MTNEREPLWSDERIEAELRRIGDNMRLYIADAATVAEQVRDDMQARIAELEAQLSEARIRLSGTESAFEEFGALMFDGDNDD